MEHLQAAVGTVGVGITVAALFGMLFPSGNIKKAGETAIAILLLFLLISPVIRARPEKSGVLAEDAEQDLYAFSEEAVYKNAVEILITNTLFESGIAVQSVNAVVKINDGNAIQLLAVTVICDEKTDVGALTNVLQTQLEIPTEIVAVQGG